MLVFPPRRPKRRAWSRCRERVDGVGWDRAYGTVLQPSLSPHGAGRQRAAWAVSGRGLCLAGCSLAVALQREGRAGLINTVWPLFCNFQAVESSSSPLSGQPCRARGTSRGVASDSGPFCSVMPWCNEELCPLFGH